MNSHVRCQLYGQLEMTWMFLSGDEWSHPRIQESSFFLLANPCVFSSVVGGKVVGKWEQYLI